MNQINATIDQEIIRRLGCAHERSEYTRVQEYIANICTNCNLILIPTEDVVCTSHNHYGKRKSNRATTIFRNRPNCEACKREVLDMEAEQRAFQRSIRKEAKPSQSKQKQVKATMKKLPGRRSSGNPAIFGQKTVWWLD